MADLLQEDMVYNDKEPLKVQGRGAIAPTIMEFWTMEGYAVEFLICVAVVEFTSLLGGEKVSGKVLSDGI